jgi:prepilin-type N-terminal cleavage/methylation domain-containing protein
MVCVMRRAFTPSDGFSLIELMIVVALIAVFAGMAVVAIGTAMTTARGDSAMAQVAGILRTGREAAINQGRTIEVRFEQPRRIRLVRLDLPEGETVIAEAGLENGAAFHLETDLPDTPDEFGHGEAIDFDGAETIRFLPDSSLADQANVTVSGTVFIGIAGDINSARAVTVTGASARAQAYRWTGAAWEAQ